MPEQLIDRDSVGRAKFDIQMLGTGTWLQDVTKLCV